MSDIISLIAIFVSCVSLWLNIYILYRQRYVKPSFTVSELDDSAVVKPNANSYTTVGKKPTTDSRNETH